MQCTMCRLQCNKIIINPTQSCTIYSNARWSTLMQWRTMFVNNNSYSAIVYIACQWCALISFYWKCLDWSKLYVFNSLLWCKKSKGAAHNEGVKMAPLLHQASSDWMWDWKGKGTKGETLVSKTFTRPNMSTYMCVCQCNNQWKSRGSVARQFTLIGNTFAGIFKHRTLSGIRQLIGHSVIDLLLAPAHTGPPQFQCMRCRDAAQRTQSVHMWRWKEALGL